MYVNYTKHTEKRKEKEEGKEEEEERKTYEISTNEISFFNFFSGGCAPRTPRPFGARLRRAPPRFARTVT